MIDLLKISKTISSYYWFIWLCNYWGRNNLKNWFKILTLLAKFHFCLGNRGLLSSVTDNKLNKILNLFYLFTECWGTLERKQSFSIYLLFCWLVWRNFPWYSRLLLPNTFFSTIFTIVALLVVIKVLSIFDEDMLKRLP